MKKLANIFWSFINKGEDHEGEESSRYKDGNVKEHLGKSPAEDRSDSEEYSDMFKKRGTYTA